MKSLVVFDTKHGATLEVAETIAEGIREAGGEAETLDLRERESFTAKLDDYDAVVLGGPSYMGRWSKRAVAFASSKQDELAGKRLALFVVGNDKDKGAEIARAALSETLASRAQTAYFGGRIDFPSLSGFERFIVKAVSGKAESASTLDLAGAREFGRGLAKRDRE